MEKLERLISNLKELEVNVIKTIERTIKDNENIIIDMNTEDQLYDKGINRLGVELMDFKPYTPFTVSVKKKKGQVTTRVTLRDEGDFQKSFYIEYSAESFEIKASDEKTEALMKKYGKQIMGLSDINFKEIAFEYVAPEVLKEIQKMRV
jgi:hypothetical protein